MFIGVCAGVSVWRNVGGGACVCVCVCKCHHTRTKSGKSQKNSIGQYVTQCNISRGWIVDTLFGIYIGSFSLKHTHTQPHIQEKYINSLGIQYDVGFVLPSPKLADVSNHNTIQRSRACCINVYVSLSAVY